MGSLGYSQLKIKYINELDRCLKALHARETSIVIEPAYVPSKDTRVNLASSVTAPIIPNLYASPSERVKFRKTTAGNKQKSAVSHIKNYGNKVHFKANDTLYEIIITNDEISSDPSVKPAEPCLKKYYIDFYMNRIVDDTNTVVGQVKGNKLLIEKSTIELEMISLEDAETNKGKYKMLGKSYVLDYK